MNELRNLLRHIIPGVVFAIELFILIFITLTCDGRSLLINNIIQTKIGAAIGFLLVFSGLGFIFSIIHHIFYHYFYRILFIFFKSDYGSFINQMRNYGFLKLKYDTDENVPSDVTFSPCGEWRIINTIWYSRIEESLILKGAHERRDKVSWDIAHGNGAALIGSIFAFISWLYLFHSGCMETWEYTFTFECKWYLPIIVLSIIVMHSISFYTTIRMAVGFTQHIISNDLYSYKKSYCIKPVEIIISKNDINGSFLEELFMIICFLILAVFLGTLFIFTIFV